VALLLHVGDAVRENGPRLKKRTLAPPITIVIHSNETLEMQTTFGKRQEEEKREKRLLRVYIYICAPHVHYRKAE